MTFGIDIDEVLRDTLSQMIKIYNVYFNDNKTKEDIHSFVVEDTFPRIEKETGINPAEWFFQLHSKEIFEDADALPNVIEALDKLRQYGKIVIISYQKTIENKIQALNWLEKHGIKYDGICFIKNKEIVHTDVLVDDNDWNFTGCPARLGILINAPYNKDINLEELKKKSCCMNLIRSNSLYDFACSFKLETLDK